MIDEYTGQEIISPADKLGIKSKIFILPEEIAAAAMVVLAIALWVLVYLLWSDRSNIQGHRSQVPQEQLQSQEQDSLDRSAAKLDVAPGASHAVRGLRFVLFRNALLSYRSLDNWYQHDR